MTFFELNHEKEDASARLVGDVGRALQHALVRRKSLEKITQREIADKLGVDRSAVNKMFSGYRNMTLASLAELCWAMDVVPHLVLEQLLEDRECNQPAVATRPPVKANVANGQNALRSVANRFEVRMPQALANAN